MTSPKPITVTYTPVAEYVGPEPQPFTIIGNAPTGGGGEGGAVDSVNGKTGAVTLSASDVGAAAASHTHAIAGVTGLQAALDAKPDMEDLPDSPADIGAATAAQGAKADTAVQPAALSSYVPTTRTVAGKALSGNISLAKADVGLGNVDNTTDANKPVSTATQNALDGKANASHTHSTAQVTGLDAALTAKAPLASPAFTGTPTGITKAHVGLGNVDNTADSAKPVSTATQTALNAKINSDSPRVPIVMTRAAFEAITPAAGQVYVIQG